MTKQTTKTATLKVIGMYNLGFFGGRREGTIETDGQYTVIASETEFVAVKIGGYGNLISFPKVENPKTAELAEADYRYIHDAILANTRGSYEASQPDIELFENGTRYKLNKKPISKNVQYGDTVKNLATGETFKVDHNYDIQHINRDFQYKITNREVHPQPETLENFIKANEAKNPFDGWKKLDAMPKINKQCIVELYIINGETYRAIMDYTGNGKYTIQTPAGEVYEKSSSVSAPFYDTIDILSGLVRSEYDGKLGHRYTHVYKDVVHQREGSQEFFHANRYVKATEPTSYYYNTRMTYL